MVKRQDSASLAARRQLHCSARRHEEYVATLCDLGGGRIASTSGDGTVRVWSRHDGQCLHTLEWPDRKHHDPADLVLANGGRFIIQFDDAVMLIDAQSGQTLRQWDYDSYKVRKVLLHRTDQFITATIDEVILAELATGEVQSRIALPGILEHDGFAQLGDKSLVIMRMRNPHRHSRIELWDLPSAIKLGSVEASNFNPLSVHIDQNDQTARIICDDYRELILALDPLRLAAASGVAGTRNGPFLLFDPYEETSGDERLRLTYFEREPGRAVDLSDQIEQVQGWRSGMFGDGRIAIALRDSWRIYAADLSGFEDMPDYMMGITHPEFLRRVHEAACAFGSEVALVERAASTLCVPVATIKTTIATFREKAWGVKLLAVANGGIVALVPKSSQIWRLRNDGTAFDWVCEVLLAKIRLLHPMACYIGGLKTGRNQFWFPKPPCHWRPSRVRGIIQKRCAGATTAKSCNAMAAASYFSIRYPAMKYPGSMADTISPLGALQKRKVARSSVGAAFRCAVGPRIHFPPWLKSRIRANGEWDMKLWSRLEINLPSRPVATQRMARSWFGTADPA